MNFYDDPSCKINLSINKISSQVSETCVLRVHSLWQGERRNPACQRGGRTGCDPQQGGGGAEGGRIASQAVRQEEKIRLGENCRDQAG